MVDFSKHLNRPVATLDDRLVYNIPEADTDSDFYLEEEDAPDADTTTAHGGLTPGTLPPPTSVFSLLSGEAGVGKTFTARAWADTDRSSQLCATTGIAALNLGGTTINALLGYFDTASLRDIYVTGRLHAKLRKNAEGGIRWYLLDEVSMLSGDQLTYLVRAIEEVNKPTPLEVSTGRPHKPIRLTLIGDFAQLPPVNEKFAFQSQYWDRFTPHVSKLTTIMRQSDFAFIEALQAVRRGNGAKALDYFRERFHPAPEMHFKGTTILAKNDGVDRFNFDRLERLHGKDLTFTKSQSGQGYSEWNKIPLNLQLKEGALVMILANKRTPPSTRFEYVNGDLGTLVTKVEGTAIVVLERTGEEVEVELVTRHHLRPASAERRQQLREQGNAHLVKEKSEVVGSVTYMPLRAAYATTVHKSQGLSLDSVQIDIRNHFYTHPGMTYVAMSRARTPEGLRLVGNPDLLLKRCGVAPDVLPWL